MAGTSFRLYVLVSFHTRDVFCALSPFFVQSGFRLFCVRLAVLYFAVYSVLGSLITPADFNGNGNEYNGCVSVRYNSLFISLPLFTKGHKTTR